MNTIAMTTDRCIYNQGVKPFIDGLSVCPPEDRYTEPDLSLCYSLLSHGLCTVLLRSLYMYIDSGNGARILVMCLFCNVFYGHLTIVLN